MPDSAFQPGLMRSVVVFERDISTPSPTSGAKRPWVAEEVAECRARVRPLRGEEFVVKDRVVTAKMYELTIHYREDLDEQMRARLADGRYLYIRHIPQVEPGQRYLDIRAEETQ